MKNVNYARTKSKDASHATLIRSVSLATKPNSSDWISRVENVSVSMAFI